MSMRRHRTFASFIDAAAEWYARDAARHTGPLSVMFASARYERPPVLLTSHAADGETLGSYLRTPPYPGLTSGVPVEHAPEFAAALVGADPELDRVQGPREETEALARAWCRLRDVEAEVRGEQGLYELGELVPPVGVPGRPDEPRERDRSWLGHCCVAFERAMGQVVVPSPEAMVERLVLARRRPLLWFVDDEPVAMAFDTEIRYGMSRVGYVYTDPAHRGHGYGSAVTAALSGRLRAAGAGRVVLFTDLANPISNRIYRRMGYRRISDGVDIGFTPR